MSDNVEQFQGEDFLTFVARVRYAHESRRQSLVRQRDDAVSEIDSAIAEIDRELAAIDAYERAKTGKAPASTATRQPRQRRRDVTEQVMNALLEAPDGLRRARIIEALGVKGDKPGEMSVSNALTRLSRAGRITRREDQHWVISEPLQQAAE